MMPRGRPRKPLSLHEQHGTFRDDRHIPDQPRPDALLEVPMPPACFGTPKKLKKTATEIEIKENERAKALHEIWYQVCSALVLLRVLTPADFGLVELYVRELYVMRTGWDMALPIEQPKPEKKGKKPPQQGPINQWYYLYAASVKRCMELGAQLGLSPVARTRIGVKNSAPKDPMADFFK